jgi:hypothetical protein
MAITLSTNLKLRISSDLTADAIYNLNKIDTLGAFNKSDTLGNLLLKATSNILIQPNSADLGGTGSGGSVIIGEEGSLISSLQVFSSLLSLSGSLSFTNGINSISLSLPTGLATDLEFTLPSSLGTDGQVLVSDGLGGMEWQTGSVTDIVNSQISPSAGISLSKLATLATDKVLVSTAGGVISTSTISSTELGYLSGASGNLQAQIDNISGTNQLAVTWVPGDGLTKTVTHNFGSQNILIQVLNTSGNYATIDVESVTRPDANTAVLTATELPVSSWLILLSQIGT